MQRHHPGFTLVELAIVLAIIGLIVGGVLVGQDLIRSAELRAQMTQLNQFSVATSTFQMQYSALPGDFANSPAVAGLQTRTGVLGRGDGNGAIQSPGTNPFGGGGEVFMYWRDLSDLNMIKFQSQWIDADVVPIINATLGTYLPEAAVRQGNRVTIYHLSGLHFYHISRLTAVDDGSTNFTGTTGLSPEDAHTLDVKLDDGFPNTGIVRAAGGTPSVVNTVDVTDDNQRCADGTDPEDAYDLGGGDTYCALRIRL